MTGPKTNEREGTRAVLHHSRISAFKVRPVLDLIRGKDVAGARAGRRPRRDEQVPGTASEPETAPVAASEVEETADATEATTEVEETAEATEATTEAIEPEAAGAPGEVPDATEATATEDAGDVTDEPAANQQTEQGEQAGERERPAGEEGT